MGIKFWRISYAKKMRLSYEIFFKNLIQLGNLINAVQGFEYKEKITRASNILKNILQFYVF